MPSPRPLAQFPLLATRSVEEAESALSHNLARCRIQASGSRRKFDVQMNGVQFGKTSLVYNRYSSAARVRTEFPDSPVFFVVGNGGESVFRVHGQTQSTRSASPLLIANASEMHIDREAGSGIMTLRVPLSVLKTQSETMANRHLRGDLSFRQGSDLSTGPGAYLSGLIAFLTNSLAEDPALLRSRAFRKGADEMLLNALLSLPNSWSERLDGDPPHEVSPGLVNRAADYMREHFAAPITISDLAAGEHIITD